jgi:alpha-tubulin suppressor-like RCC1 family protein
MRSQKRLLAAALSAILVMPLMSIILVPSANAVSNLQLSRGIQGEGVGRADEHIQFDVYSKLANGSTTSTDVIYAWIEGAPSGFAGSTDIKLPVSTDITNSIQHAYFEIPVTIAGNYSIRFCATVPSIEPTTNYGSYTGAPEGGNWTHIRSCEAKNIKVGEAPALISLGERTIYASTVSNNQTSNPIHFGLFDASGNRTILKSGESLSVSMSAGQVSVSSAAGGSALGNQISLTNANKSDVGTYRAFVGNTVPASQQITISGGGAISALTSATAILDTRPRASISGQTPNLLNFQNGVFGTGSDGDFYRWGLLSAGFNDNVSNVDVLNKTLLKPTKEVISSGVRATKLWSCWQNWGSSCGSYGFLAEDGSIWADGGYDGNFPLSQRITGNFRPLILPFTTSLKIVDISFGARIVVLSDGSVWKRNDSFIYSKLDLTPSSTPIIKSVVHLWSTDTTIMLADNGDIYSVGGNAQGQLGQGSDSAASLGKVLLPTGKVASRIFGGENWAGAQLTTGSVVTWGRNDRGQQGKVPAEVPYLNTPRTLVTPGEISVTRVDATDRGIVAYGTNAAGRATAYLAMDGSWHEVGNGYVPSTSGILSYYTDSAAYRLIIVDSDFKVYQQYLRTGNCYSENGRIRSDGAFGPVWYEDPLSYGTRLLTIGNNVTQVPDVVTVSVGDTFTVQVANVRTRCYSATELTYAWDRDGNGTYETPDTAVLGDTGYLALNGTFNFANAGRYLVALGVTTPDGVTLSMPLTVGVDPLVRNTLALSGESVTVASSWHSAIAIGTDKEVYTWGYNQYGQLGLPQSYEWVRTPTKLTLPESVTALNVAVTDRSSFIVDTDGKVWMLGESELLDKTSTKIYSPVLFSPLSRWNIRDIAVNGWSRHGIALTTTGQVIAFGRNFSPTPLKSLAGLTIKKIGISHENALALDSLGNLYQIVIGEDRFESAIKISGLSDVVDFNTVSINDSTWFQVSVTTSNGDVYYRRTNNYENLTFQKVTLPAGVTIRAAAPMAGYGKLLVADTSGAIWQSTMSQSPTVFEQTAWTKFSAASLGRLNAQDMPMFKDMGGRFIGFKSGRLMNFGGEDSTRDGRCGYSWQGSDNTVSVISQGQFGPALNIDTDMYTSNPNVAVGAEAARDLSNGAQIGVSPNSDLTIKFNSFYTQCFPGQQMKVKADLDGSGQFATTPEISMENGSAVLVISTAAPASGRRTISIRFITPLGTTKTMTLNVGVYSTAPNPLVTDRKSVFHAGFNVSTAPGTDGKIYTWGGDRANRRLISETPPRSVSQPTPINLLGSTSIRDAVVIGYGNDSAVLAVSSSGKTYSWGARPGVNMSSTTYTSGSVPTTPTEIPALVGVDVVRIDATEGRAMALTSGGVVYEWGDGNNRVPYKVAGLAGVTVVDIWCTDGLHMALSSTGDLYTWRSSGDRLGWSTPSADYWISAPWYWDPNNPIKVGKVPVGEAVKSAAQTPYGVLIISTTNKLYFFGRSSNFITYQPVQRNLPGGRVPAAVGVGVGDYGTIVATDGTWWNPSSDSNDQLSFIQYTNPDIETGTATATGLLNSGVVDFARGSGRAAIKADGSLVTYSWTHGTCGATPNGFGRVMSEGQLGPIFRDDSLNIYVAGGGGLIRPGTATDMTLTAYSNCYGGAGLTISADLLGTGIYANPTLGTVSEDGNSASTTFNFTLTRSGFFTASFKVTSASGLTATTTSSLSVVPLPPAGRLIGISINGGARYTNTQDVIVDLVWPDGVTSITVSNDGGFAPGTFQVVDLQEHINWQLPPQAVIPLPAIVYARFGDSTAYYFDDIIVDSVSPVLTYVAAG